MARSHSQWSTFHRPTKLSEVIGQNTKAINGIVKSGSAVLINGPSGSGKTTISRIIASMVHGESQSASLKEINCGEDTGVEKIRNMLQTLKYKPRHGKWVVILDECHALSKSSISTLLKNIEDSPPHVMYILCTDQPQRLPRTLLNRCRNFEIKIPEPEETAELLVRVAKTEGYKIKNIKQVALKIAKAAEGVPRMSLQILQTALESTEQEEGKPYKISKLEVTEAIKTPLEDIDQLVGQILRTLYMPDKNVDQCVEHILKITQGCDGYGVVLRLITANHFGAVMQFGGSFDWRGKVFKQALTDHKIKPSLRKLNHVTVRLVELRKLITELSVDPVVSLTSTLIKVRYEIEKIK